MHLTKPCLHRAWPRAALLLVSIAVAGPLGADPLVARAQQKSAAGDSESAARLYRSWLALNADAPGSGEVFSRYFRLERDVPVLLDSSERFLSGAGRAAHAVQQLIPVAQLFELAGRVEGARDAYLKAFEATGSASALLSSALLSLETNDFDALAKCRESLKGREGPLDSLLGLLVDLQAGDGASARGALLAFAATCGDRDLSLKAIWAAYSSAMAAGDQQAAADARRRLTSGYPGAPETALASRAGPPGKGSAVVVALPRPDLSAATAPRDTAPQSAAPPAASTAGPTTVPAAGTPAAEHVSPSGAPAAAPPATAAPPQSTEAAPPSAAATVSMAVQAGAFRVRENADDLVTDLNRRGFHPSLREDSVQGVVHYRVFAGTGMAAEAAKDLLSRLTQAGFSGFLVAEK
jgi:cell division protein FtsN